MTLFMIGFATSILIAVGVGIMIGIQLERSHAMLWTEDELRKKIRSN